MTQLEFAKLGKITPQMETVAKKEKIDVNKLRELIALGKVVLPYNSRHKNLTKPCAIGNKLATKVNANIGTSPDCADLSKELAKLQAAVTAGTDTVMDLSTGGDLNLIRQTIIENSPVPVGTVPIYQAAVEARKKKKAIVHLTEDEIFAIVEEQAQSGVDFMTIHCGVTFLTLEKMQNQGRITDVVSRGGALCLEWMIYNQKENPFYEHFDRLLKIAKEYDIVLSLGDGFRPGCIADATDRAQVQELIIVGELAKKAFEAGVQVMIEGPGHMPINQIVANVLLEKKLCNEAPFYVLGPIVTDIAPGYDHITAAIGGAIAAAAGADFLCYVTASEHLRLPTPEDVYEGVIAARIAAHAGDIVKGVVGAIDWDNQIARFRKSLDWDNMLNLAIDPHKPKKMRNESLPYNLEVCTMCGEYCAMREMNLYLSKFKPQK